MPDTSFHLLSVLLRLVYLHWYSPEGRNLQALCLAFDSLLQSFPADFSSALFSFGSTELSAIHVLLYSILSWRLSASGTIRFSLHSIFLCMDWYTWYYVLWNIQTALMVWLRGSLSLWYPLHCIHLLFFHMLCTDWRMHLLYKKYLYSDGPAATYIPRCYARGTVFRFHLWSECLIPSWWPADLLLMVSYSGCIPYGRSDLTCSAPALNSSLTQMPRATVFSYLPFSTPFRSLLCCFFFCNPLWAGCFSIFQLLHKSAS